MLEGNLCKPRAKGAPVVKPNAKVTITSSYNFLAS